MFNVNLKIVAVIAAIVLVTAGYSFVRYQGAVAERERQYKKDVEAFMAQASKSAAIATALEEQLSKLRAENRKLAKELQDETASNPVYNSCRITPNGLRILKEAVSNASR